MALGAQAVHPVAYRDLPEGALIYTVFTKKCQKWSKKGVPPVFDHFWEDFGYQGTPHTRMAPRGGANRPHFRPIRALVGIFLSAALRLYTRQGAAGSAGAAVHPKPQG